MRRWAPQRILTILLALGLLGTLGGCGRKGPLYLPQESAPKPAESGVHGTKPAEGPSPPAQPR